LCGFSQYENQKNRQLPPRFVRMYIPNAMRMARRTDWKRMMSQTIWDAERGAL
jgi:hypothetical protein